MDCRKVLSWMASFGLALLLLSACSTPQPVPPAATPLPTATAAPLTATPVPEVPEWDYVAIGSYILYPHSPETYYAAYIESDLGVKVNQTTKSILGLAGDDCPLNSNLLEHLRTNSELQDAIGEAEVVTISGIGLCEIWGATDNANKPGQCGGVDDMDCVRNDLAAFKTSSDAVFDEILSLCRPGTIVRVRTMPRWEKLPAGLAYVKPDVDTALIFDLFNEQVVQSASEHHLPVARVDVAFYGATGNENPRDKGYGIGDWADASTPQGMVAVADLLRDMGYEPTVP